MDADRLIRASTTVVVVTLAGIAAYVTYQHGYEVVRANGEGPATARLVPLTVDGLVYASSMVILHCARHRMTVPGLAWLLLGAGIAAVLAANVAHGLAYGPGGALVGAWPAVALVGGYELLMWLVRSSADQPAPAPVADEPAHAPATEPTPVLESTGEPVDDAADARKAYRASLDANEPLSERALAARYGRSRNWARSRITEAAEHEGGPALRAI